MASQVPETEVHKYASLLDKALAKLTALRPWKERSQAEGFDRAPFDQELREGLEYCKAAFSIFRDDQQFNILATALADAVVEIRNFLGTDLMPLSKYHVFSRGIFEVGGKTIISGQYYQEIPFYGPPRPVAVQAGNVPEITKFHEWKVIDCPRDQIRESSIPVQCIYYLEKGSMNGVYYVLGYSAPSMHATVQLYQHEKPSFFTVEERMIEAVLRRSTPAVASYYGRD